MTSDFSDISKFFDGLVQNFGTFGNDLTKGLDKVGDALKQMSNFSEEENLVILEVYKKISKEDLEEVKTCLAESNKDKIKEILSKYCSNEKIIDTIILSSGEYLDLEKKLSKDFENIINIFKSPAETKLDTKSDDNKVDDNKVDETKNDEEIDIITSTIKDTLSNNECLNVDMSTVRNMIDQIMTRVEKFEGMEGVGETTRKVVDSLESKLGNSGASSVSFSDTIGNLVNTFENKPKMIKVREGLVLETSKMIQEHKKLSDDINTISKTLTTAEIEMLEKECGGELPLDFRLRMMENTIQKLDQKLVGSEERDGLDELKEKIDDIAVNIDILLTRLAKIVN